MAFTISNIMKDPDSVLDYGFDWSDWLVTGETISTSGWEVPTGITNDSDTNTTTTTTIWLSGGTASTNYRLVNEITTSAGRTEQRSIDISVTEKVPLVLIVETGASLTTSNTYCTLAQANTYHSSRLHVSDWTDAYNDTRNRALVQATRMLDNLVEWDGYKTDSDQALRWPRTGVIDPDDDAVDSDAIPTFLREATAEFARLLIASDREADSGTAGFKELEAGSLRMVIDKYDKIPTIPLSVWTMVMHYGIRTTGKTRVLVRR